LEAFQRFGMLMEENLRRLIPRVIFAGVK